MSVNGLFDIGQTALVASQAALAVTSNNIANVNTPGYSRQDVILSIARPVQTSAGFIGSGVTAQSIERSYDRFIQAQLLGQQQNQGRSAAMDQSWGQIEALLNETQGVGLATPLTDFFNAWNDLATSPESPAARSVLLEKAGVLTRTAATLERGMVSVLNTTNASISDDVRQINSLASDIAALNESITQIEAGQERTSANTLRDQRDMKLTELSKLVDFSSYEDPNGSITVIVGMRNLVSGAKAGAISTSPNLDGNPDLFLDGINITSQIHGGAVSGLITARDAIQTNTLTGLRRLMAALTQQVNTLHRSGFGLDGSTGNDFFNPLQVSTTGNSAGAAISATVTSEADLSLDEYRITFSGGNYNVYNKQTGALVTTGAYNAAGTTISLPPSPPAAASGVDVTISGPVTNTDVFYVSPLTTAVSGFGAALTDPNMIAAASTLAGVPGDNSAAIGIARLADTSVSALGNATFSGYYNSVVSTAGAAKQATADSLSFDDNLLSQLQQQRDSVSGVSLDEESANLIRFQRAYQAGAQVIKVADELYQTLLNL
jgi:flagellar hook-associated protein 1 FlgK